MQNIVNYLVPFFNEDGKPVSAGRVHFVKKGTSATKFDDITSPDYIVIKDRNGTVLENPLKLSSVGTFSIQPFADEGVDFKMIVDEPTGLSAELNNGIVDDTNEWRTITVMDSESQRIDLSIDGMSYVDSIAELRELDTENKCAVVLGYSEKNDYCPARIFRWTSLPYIENYGTHIKSNKDRNGVWVCEPEDVLDLRWFGVNPNVTQKTDYSYIISQASQAYPRLPVYFAGGTYYISINMDLNSVIIGKNCFIRPYDKIVQMTIGHLENRGGKFFADDNSLESAKVIPVVGREFRSSLLSGNLCSFVFAPTMGMQNIFRYCDIIILDSFNDDDTILDYPAISKKAQYLSGKTIVVNGGATPLWMKYVGKECVIVNGYDGSVKVKNAECEKIKADNSASVGNLSISPFNEDTRISKNGKIVASISNEMISFPSIKIDQARISNLILDVIHTSENINLTILEQGLYQKGSVILVHNTKNIGIKVYVGSNRIYTEGKIEYVNVGAGMMYMFYCALTRDDSAIPRPIFYNWNPVGNYIVNQEDA